jgi:hypothetical protein
VGVIEYLDLCVRIRWARITYLRLSIHGNYRGSYRCVSRGTSFSISQFWYGYGTSSDVGGQYYWTSRLAPKKYARVLSYTTGYLGWAGAVVVSGSVAVGLAQALVGMIILAHPDVLF